MNIPNTRSVEILLGLLFTQIIVFALAFYMLYEPARLPAAQQQILVAQLDDSMSLYAQNCAVCHGLAGEGIGATPPLNNPALRSMSYDDLFKTIARGRFNTAMPAWSESDGGPLSDYQVSEMVALIQFGDWNAAKERVINLGLAPLVPFTTEPDPALLEQVGLLPDGATLQAAITIFSGQCVACHGADGLGTGIAPALNDPAIREKTVEELTTTITYGRPGTLMAAWSNTLSPEEITAMTTLLNRWDEVPAGVLPAPDVLIATTAESLVRGGELFSANCSRCHGPEGQGTPRAPALNVKGFLVDTSDQAIQQIVTLGVSGTAMPAWGDRITAADIQAIVGFIRQWEANAPEVAVPTRAGGGGPPWLRTTPASIGAAPAGAAPTGAVTGQGSAAQKPGSLLPSLDWRTLLLLTGGLSIAFTLISMGYQAVRRK